MGDLKSVRYAGILLILFLICFRSSPSWADDKTESSELPYELSFGWELALLPAGAAISGVGIYLSATMDYPTEAEIEALDRNDVPGFDRRATYNHSVPARWVSDVGLVSMLTAPTLMLVPALMSRGARWRQAATLGTMYVEALLWTASTTMITRTIAERPRPLAYNEHFSMDERTDEQFVSFFSGHASFSFCSAVFLSTVFLETYPDSPWRFIVVGTSLSLATTTGVMRIAAGKHFPSDVIVGAAAGSFFGYMIPFVHLKRIWRDKAIHLSVIPQVSADGSGLVLSATF